MTDERYVYHQDLKEKNSAKSGAYHKRSGRRTKYVSLPSDHLTPAQLKRRNGPVETIKLNQPMTYTELKKLSPYNQFFYLDNLVTRYKARRKDIVAMLCISENCFAKLMKQLPGKLIFGHGSKGKKHPEPEWLAFIGAEKTAPVSPDVLEVGEPISVKAEDVEPVFPITLDKPLLIAKPEVNPYRVTLEMNGTPAQLSDLLAVLTDSSTAYNFTVAITAGKEDA